ncbi:MAG: hypothetical protein SPI77_03465 [Corynebacterium sp.]|nr:hypothetical protein [Corynebacterium sp.]
MANYSPLQNAALWLAAWLYGHVPTDNVIEALTELRLPITLEILKEIRATADLETVTLEPVIQLLLSGPGEPSAYEPDEAIAIRGTNSWMLIYYVSADRANEGRQPGWYALAVDTPLIAPPPMSPGEADLALADAARAAAEYVERSGLAGPDLPQPRLTVGTLTDFFEAPGIPAPIPIRAARLLARADRLAAIIETVTERADHHSFDPALFSLSSHIRHARIAGVSNAVASFVR